MEFSESQRLASDLLAGIRPGLQAGIAWMKEGMHESGNPSRCWEFVSLDFTQPPNAMGSNAGQTLGAFRSYPQARPEATT